MRASGMCVYNLLFMGKSSPLAVRHQSRLLRSSLQFHCFLIMLYFMVTRWPRWNRPSSKLIPNTLTLGPSEFPSGPTENRSPHRRENMSLHPGDVTVRPRQFKRANLVEGGKVYSVSPVNHRDTTQSWPSMSLCVWKGAGSVFLSGLCHPVDREEVASGWKSTNATRHYFIFTSSLFTN